MSIDCGDSIIVYDLDYSHFYIYDGDGDRVRLPMIEEDINNLIGALQTIKGELK